MLRIVLLLIALVNVSAKCDNSCSGHGTCTINDVCQCYDNWGLGLFHDSGDCSQRICPFEFAWVDTPDANGYHHRYMECAAKGICNRDSGECECFPGYEGKGCQRTTCPNDCSGHGLCRFIEQMPFQSVPDDYKHGEFGLEDPKIFEDSFRYWDLSKTRGCVCDPTWGDIDCSKRMCPYGTDIMDIRQNMVAAAKFQTQHITFVAGQVSALNGLGGDTFALTFKSRLNETFTTIPIVVKVRTEDDFHGFLFDVENALENLPNRVIDDVTVAGYALKDTVPDPDVYKDEIYLNITFIGENVQGPQNLLTVQALQCLDGCTPKLTGLELRPMTQNVTEVQLSDFNSFECGRRGKCDYSTGNCVCFAGYTGLACNTITALV